MDCHKCVHYYVTWDEKFPHGCRAMRFKSRLYPVNVVRNVIQGRDCLLYLRRSRETSNGKIGHGPTRTHTDI